MSGKRMYLLYIFLIAVSHLEDEWKERPRNQIYRRNGEVKLSRTLGSLVVLRKQTCEYRLIQVEEALLMTQASMKACERRYSRDRNKLELQQESNI
jgi:hypothetical protein